MNGRANGKRSYRSTLRAARAGDTRSALLATAARLFATRGYVATSIDEIAREAGIGRATVFTSIGGKPALLKAAYDVALVGDAEAVPLVERSRSRAIRSEPDARRYLELYAKLASEVAGRVATISEVVRSAAGADLEARALYEKMQSERLIGARHIVGDVKSKGGLRKGLDTATAVDIVWTLIEPAIYVRLVHQRGWSARRYTRWLAETLKAQLLGT
jgi:TetR/AcrR family transcriptional regulator, regulator of autoinduction and epiphytic fitness